MQKIASAATESSHSSGRNAIFRAEQIGSENAQYRSAPTLGCSGEGCTSAVNVSTHSQSWLSAYSLPQRTLPDNERQYRPACQTRLDGPVIVPLSPGEQSRILKIPAVVHNVFPRPADMNGQSSKWGLVESYWTAGLMEGGMAKTRVCWRNSMAGSGTSYAHCFGGNGRDPIHGPKT